MIPFPSSDCVDILEYFLSILSGLLQERDISAKDALSDTASGSSAGKLFEVSKVCLFLLLFLKVVVDFSFNSYGKPEIQKYLL